MPRGKHNCNPFIPNAFVVDYSFTDTIPYNKINNS